MSTPTKKGYDGGIRRGFTHERTLDLARNVLHDIGCIEHATIKCAELSENEHAQRAMRVPALIFEFDYPEADRCPALAVGLVHWAMGTRTDDDLRRIIREKIEGYLKMIGRDPGRNDPGDMRLNEEFYA